MGGEVMAKHPRPVFMNTDILDCEMCHAMTDSEYKWQLLRAALRGEPNHMATHLVFGIGPGPWDPERKVER
jgi:hypothetical protein